MTEGRSLRAALRFDSGGWRRFAELGCVYGPEWWKRTSPPVIAAIIFGIARAQREAVFRNQGVVLGPRSWLRSRWDAYRTFAECARSMTEGLEQWGPRPKPLDIRVVGGEQVERALAEGRGLIVITGHFGSWEIAARVIGRLGRPASMVTAHEPNPTARRFIHQLRTRHGFNVIYSDRSMFTGLPILQALRRHEIVGMQIEPWGPKPGSHEVLFCGRPTRVQLGPFAMARIAKAPIVAVFALRTGIRSYQLRVTGRFDPTTRAESIAALEATATAYGQLIREYPSQWLMFEEVWRDGTAEGQQAPARSPRVAGLG